MERSYAALNIDVRLRQQRQALGLFASSAGRRPCDVPCVVCRHAPRTGLQGFFKIDRAAVFLQKIGECFIRQFLERPHAVPGIEVKRRPGLVVDLDAFARH